MQYSEDIYQEKLYPLMDGVLKMACDSRSPFFLTGGTALSRFYFNHRYSDDLDFFLNSRDDFLEQAGHLIEKLSGWAELERYEIIEDEKIITNTYMRLVLCSSGVKLKIDLVNDIEFRVKPVWKHEKFGFCF